MANKTSLYSSDVDFAVLLCKLYSKSIKSLKAFNNYGRNFADIETCHADAIHRAMNYQPWQPEY